MITGDTRCDISLDESDVVVPRRTTSGSFGLGKLYLGSGKSKVVRRAG